MKNLLLLSLTPIVFAAVLVITFLIISIGGILFYPYGEIISNETWFIVYTMFFGMWWSGFIAIEYGNWTQD